MKVWASEQGSVAYAVGRDTNGQLALIVTMFRGSLGSHQDARIVAPKNTAGTMPEGGRAETEKYLMGIL